MTEPDDYGLSPAATLAHVGDPARSARHGAFWKAWAGAVFEGPSPRLMERTAGGRDEDASDPTATHRFESARHVRIGCALALPRGRARAGVVALHGYGDVPSLGQAATDCSPLVERGAAVLAVRVRGYPGSRLDTPHLNAASEERGGGAWITCGLEEPASERGIGCEWAFSYAVADVVNAARALLAMLGERPLFIHGESFGGALGVLAAAVLSDRAGGTPASRVPLPEIARLAVGVPGMGDWAWRLGAPGRAGIGSGDLVRRFMEDHPDRAEQVYQLLRLHDAAIHARRVRCPVLCKLALRDEVVPAPAGAAVFNALGTDPGQKWRHVVKYGHFDGGIADMRKHAAFGRRVVEFLDPAREPAEAMAEFEERRLAGAAG
ncbi:MAG: acetylxylan esterase [Phycisphaerales bacterium]